MTIKVSVGVNEMNIMQADGHENRSATKSEDENEKENQCSDHEVKGSGYRIVTADCKICRQKETNSEGCEPDLHASIEGRLLGDRRTMNVFSDSNASPLVAECADRLPNRISEGCEYDKQGLINSERFEKCQYISDRHEAPGDWWTMNFFRIRTPVPQ